MLSIGRQKAKFVGDPVQQLYGHAGIETSYNTGHNGWKPAKVLIDAVV